jgi:two-component sensor histidine kinase
LAAETSILIDVVCADQIAHAHTRGSWKVVSLPVGEHALIVRDIMIQTPELATSSSGRRSRKAAIERADMQWERTDTVSQQEMLLREMQHRVANSLQIVAGILSLKARTVHSDDARLHLLDAYGRVMSIAAVQRQLLDSQQPSVIQIGDYLSELGQTLAKSLTEEVRLLVRADASVVMDSNKAVAMGLVVTELVINALRHAFPKQRPGRIVIGYKTLRSGWKLSVTDDGVGVSQAWMNGANIGHGTRIIDALANQLGANVEVKSSPQGTRVSLTHSGERRSGSQNLRAVHGCAASPEPAVRGSAGCALQMPPKPMSEAESVAQ